MFLKASAASELPQMEAFSLGKVRKSANVVHSSLIQWPEISLADVVCGSKGGLFRHLTLLKHQIMSQSNPQLHGPRETNNTALFPKWVNLPLAMEWALRLLFYRLMGGNTTRTIHWVSELFISTVVPAVFVRRCREHMHTVTSDMSFHFGKGKKGSCSTLPETILVAAKLATRESQEPMTAAPSVIFLNSGS